jgi:photosystem II stability/assembly factor-like uncharacterized protein
MFRMRLGTRDGVVTLRYENGRWHTEKRGLNDRDVWVVAHQPGRSEVVYAGTYGDGLFRTTDGGINWEQIGEEVGIEYVRAIAFAADDPNTIYVGTEPANVLRSTDGGNTWSDLGIRDLPEAEGWSLPYSPRGGAVRTLVTHPAEPSLLYGGVEQGGVLKSTDGGATWTITYNGVHPDVHTLAVHPDDPQVLFAATGGGVYRTRDGGRTWERLIDGYTRAVTIHPLLPELVFAGPARRVGHEGRILASEDGGDTWVLAARGLEIPMLGMVESFVVHPDFPNDIFAILSDGQLLRSRADHIHWRPLEPRVAAVRDLDIAEGDHSAF